MYTNQISDCYRSVLGDHDRLLAAHEKKQIMTEMIDMTRKEEESACKEAAQGRIAGAQKVLKLMVDRGFDDADLVLLVMVCCLAGIASVFFSIAAFIVARVGYGVKNAKAVANTIIRDEVEKQQEEEEEEEEEERRRRRKNQCAHLCARACGEGEIAPDCMYIKILIL